MITGKHKKEFNELQDRVSNLEKMTSRLYDLLINHRHQLTNVDSYASVPTKNKIDWDEERKKFNLMNDVLKSTGIWK